MAGDIYSEAVVEAKKLREKAQAAVEQQLVEKFRPRVEGYIERALLEASGENVDDSDADDDMLLGVDDAGAPGSKPVTSGEQDVDQTLQSSTSNGASTPEQAAISVNQDGTVTLELDKMVVPGDQQKSNDDAPGVDDVLSSFDGSEQDVVIDGAQHESIRRLASLLKLAENVGDVDARFKMFVRIARTARRTLNEMSNRRVDAKSAAVLTSLAECVKVAYTNVRRSDVPSNVKDPILSHYEATYGRVNGILAETIHERVARRIVECRRALRKGGRRTDVIKELAELKDVINAVTNRENVDRSAELRDRITGLMGEAKRMPRRGQINEEDVVLRLSLPDDESADAVRSAFSGDEADDADGEDDDADLDALLADEPEGGSDDESDDADDADEPDEKPKKGKKDKKEEAVTRSIARLFEADDSDKDDDEPDGAEPSEEDDEDADEGTDALERVVDVIRDLDGDVQVELVDDMGAGMGGDMDDMGGGAGMNDMGPELDLADDDDVIDVVDDGGGSDDDDDEIVEVDMAEVARTLREMDTAYYKHPDPGPGDGIDSFGDADEVTEPFTDPPDVRRESRRRASDRLLHETYSDEYENAMMGPRGEYWAARRAKVNSMRGGDRIEFRKAALLDALDEYDEFHEENTRDNIDDLISDLVELGLSREEILAIDGRIDPTVVDEYLSRAQVRAGAVSEGRSARRSTMGSGRRVARRQSTPTRGMAARRGRLSEGAGRQQTSSNLLQMKLLHANRILQRSDLTPLQRKRVMRAMDEARNLQEVKALYSGLTKALNERRSSTADRRHRSAGTSSSQVLTSSGIRRDPGSALGEGADVFTESIDLDAWKRHAGIDD